MVFFFEEEGGGDLGSVEEVSGDALDGLYISNSRPKKKKTKKKKIARALKRSEPIVVSSRQQRVKHLFGVEEREGGKRFALFGSRSWGLNRIDRPGYMLACSVTFIQKM